MLSDSAIQEYRDIMRKHGVETTVEEAQAQGEWLIRLYEAVFKGKIGDGSEDSDAL